MARAATTKLVASISRRPAADEELDEPRLRLGRDGRGLVLEAVARPHLVDPDASPRELVGPRSDERRVHRPLDAGDLDLDPADQVDGGACPRCRAAPRSALARVCAVEGEQLVAGAAGSVGSLLTWPAVVVALPAVLVRLGHSAR